MCSCIATAAAAIALLFASLHSASGQGDGLLTKAQSRLFPIGFYELPGDDAALRAMAESGVNLVRCHSRADLDRAEAVGLLGWIPLPVQAGATENLRKKIEAVKDHSALAIWEGPDEIVWNFTAASQLHKKRGVHKTPGEWWRQTPAAVAYAQEQAEAIIPNIRAGIELVRRLDPHNRQFWINEALQSDAKYVRQYLDSIDITGCDLYPVKHDDRRVPRMGPATDRWMQLGKGKPVWMVLQAFSWSELGDYYGETVAAYPTFSESRFMAYDVIAHGARGIMYWGSHYLKSDAFRESLYALTSELAALQPFLVAPEESDIRAGLIELKDEEVVRGVRVTGRRAGKDWLVVLVNEDDRWHMGVEVTGLTDLNGQRMDLLYGSEAVIVEGGEFITRMPPLGVKVFATGRKWESARRQGRDFGD
jgi:hypothetical protein